MFSQPLVDSRLGVGYVGTPQDVAVTFEHTPAHLTLKLLCACAGVNPRDVQRGYADLVKLRATAAAWQPVAERLAVVEGSSQLTVAQVRAQARRAMRQHQVER
jgi:hypothetical protein